MMSLDRIKAHGLADLWDKALTEQRNVQQYVSQIGGDTTHLLLELVRFLDTRVVSREYSNRPYSLLDHQTDEILRLGLNPALAILLPKVRDTTGFPLVSSTPERAGFAGTLLHHLGRIRMLQRLIELTTSGLLELRRCESKLEFIRVNDRCGIEVFDAMDAEWVNTNLHHDYMTTPKDIIEEMRSLVYNWRGDFIGYTTSHKIDVHFIEVAMKMFDTNRSIGGIHPEFKFRGISGADLIFVSALITSIYIKHIIFSLIHTQKYPDRMLNNVITIFTQQGEFADSLCEVANEIINTAGESTTGRRKFTRKKMFTCLSAMTLNKMNLKSHCYNYRIPFPALISVRRNYFIRPVSSIFDNVLSFSAKELKRIYPREWDKSIKRREEWFRMDLYSLFGGNRYIAPNGSIQLFDDGKTLTDIDAIVIDVTTGDVALFELKWQEPVGLEEIERRNKCKNLHFEISKWSNAVSTFIHDKGIKELANQLGLQCAAHRIRDVYLFALVRHNARFSGSKIATPNVAVASWGQFQRARMVLGVRDDIFKDIYKRLKDEEEIRVDAGVETLSFSVAGLDIEAEAWFTSDRDPKESPNMSGFQSLPEGA